MSPQDSQSNPTPAEGDRTRTWALLLGTTVAVAAATALVTLGIRRARAGSRPGDLQGIIDQCFQQIQQIEADLRQLRPSAESAH